MRKTFKMFCAAAIALLAVSSCGKIWDEFDSVNGEIDAINKELADLKAKVADLEAKLNSDVAAINEKLAAINSELDDVNAALAINVKFQIDPETLEVSVSYDDGATWVKTGIICNDATVAVDYEEGSDFLTLVVGGTEYSVSVYEEDNSSLVAGRADFFLRYEGSKNVELKAEGIAEYYVMNEPDGWQAVIDGTTLKVTAPTKNAIEIGAAEAEGLILVHGTTADGKCKVAKVEVKAGPGLTLAVDKDGNVTVENSYYGETVDEWSGESSFSFLGFAAGLATPEIFNEDPAAYFQTYNDRWEAPNWDILYPSLYNIAEQGQYVEGEYETDIVKTTVNDMYRNWNWDDLEPGAHFVVWVAPVDGNGKIIIEDAVYEEYLYVKINVEVASATHSSIVLNVEAVGASSYVVGYLAESDYNDPYNPMTFDQYMQMPMGGPWNAFVSYGAAEALGVVYEELPAELNLAEVYGQSLSYGETYKVWVMPMFDHLNILDEGMSMPEYDYYVYDYSGYDYETNFLPYVVEVKTNDIEAGGEYKAVLTLESSDFSSIYVNVEPSEGTETVWYNWYTAEDYAAFESDAEVMADVMDNCYWPLSGAETVSVTYKNPGEKWVLVTFSVGADGKYGEIYPKEFSTKPLPYDSNITVTLESLVVDGTNYVAVFNVTGATKLAGYNIADSDYNRTSFAKNVATRGVVGSYYGYQFVDVVDGKATVTFAQSTYKTDYLVSAYNVANDEVSAMSEVVVFNVAANLPAEE